MRAPVAPAARRAGVGVARRTLGRTSPSSIRRSSPQGSDRPSAPHHARRLTRRRHRPRQAPRLAVVGQRRPSASTVGTISSQPQAPPSTKPSAVGSSTPMPWSRSSSPSRRSDVIRPPRSGRISSSQDRSTASASGSDRSVVAVRRPAGRLCLLVAAACGPSTAVPRRARRRAQRAGIATPASCLAVPHRRGRSHVFVIVMENRSYDQALAGGYTAQLAATVRRGDRTITACRTPACPTTSR